MLLWLPLAQKGDRLMRNRIALVFSTLILLCTLFVPAVFGGTGCSMANVAGNYGYEGFGTVLAGNPLGAPAGTFSSMGILIFDGQGNLTINDTQRIDDYFPKPNTRYPSTYTVMSNCVATFTITAWAQAGLPGPHFKGIFVNNRKSFLAMSLIPGILVNYVNTTKVTD